MPILDNARQEKYIQNLVKGMTQRQAYRDAYPDNNSSDKTIDETASRLFNDSKIQTRYKEILKELEEDAIMSAKERMIWLTKVVKGEEKEETKYYGGNGEAIVYEKQADLSTKIKALDTLNKMDNAYQQNIKVSGSINNPFENMSTDELREVLSDLENE